MHVRHGVELAELELVRRVARVFRRVVDVRGFRALEARCRAGTFFSHDLVSFSDMWATLESIA